MSKAKKKRKAGDTPAGSGESTNNPVSFPPALKNQLAHIAEMINSSHRKFVIDCVEAILKLSEEPDGQRHTPELVHVIFNARHRAKSPAELLIERNATAAAPRPLTAHELDLERAKKLDEQ